MERRNLVEPAWTPDGRWISYLVSTAAGNTGDVWRQRADGSGGAERIFHMPRLVSEQVWAPSGGVLIARTPTGTLGNGDILMTRPGVDTATTSLVASAGADYSPAVSPDGKWLAYVSNETGRLEVYVTPFAQPGSGKWGISTGGGTSPRWSGRGDELFYTDLRSNMVAARIATSPSFAVQDMRVLFNAADFVQTSVSRRHFDVTPDGQRFLMVQRADGAKRGEMIVVENWAEEIRRKARQP
jgi:Tol biopolymer transport system component